ncbi:hypothetical protein F4803DRAFT_540140 [Xylaria telfairii]|nr:hypothetical protein F4803DRAFT_540140 [Xylaria telfairii]
METSESSKPLDILFRAQLGQGWIMDNSQEQEQLNVDPDTIVPVQKQSKKRVITAARKEQNKLAQRSYRRRQKELKRVRKQAVTAGPRRLAPRQNKIDASYASTFSPSSGRDTGTENSHPITDLFCSPLRDAETALSSDPEVENLLAVGPQLPSSWSSPSSDFQDEAAIVLSASIPKMLSDDDTDAYPPGLINMVNMTLGLRGSLEENSTTVFRACLTNAIRIGLDLTELMYCERPCMSPFYRPMAWRNEDQAALAAASSYDSLPLSLRPTLAQILIPHHASLDLIPLPRLRERAILMCAALPHIFSLWEMKLDVYTRNALVCHGRDASSGSVSQPWDMRSWQAAPWFVSKWNMVVDVDEVKTSLAVPGIPGMWM